MAPSIKRSKDNEQRRIGKEDVFPVYYKWVIPADQFASWFQCYESKLLSPTFGSDSVKFRLHLQYDKQVNRDLVMLELTTAISNVPPMDGLSGDRPIKEDISVQYKLSTYGNSFASEKPLKLSFGKPHIIWKTDYVFPNADRTKDKMITCELTVTKSIYVNSNSSDASNEIGWGTVNSPLENTPVNSPTPTLASDVPLPDNLRMYTDDMDNEIHESPKLKTTKRVESRSETFNVASPVYPTYAAALEGKNAVNDHMEKFIDQVTSLRSHPKYADVVFTIGDRQFYAHKNILAIRSPVFDSMFTDSVHYHEEDGKLVTEIELESIDPAAFEVLLDYIYKCETSKIKKYAAELLAVAIKFAFDSLVKECEKCLADGITVENVCKILQSAEQQNLADVKAKAASFIRNHVTEVVVTDGWKQLVKPNAALLNTIFEEIFVNANN